MNLAGPQLETLTHRLSETPTDFLMEPKIGSYGVVFVPALVNDLLVRWHIPASLQQLERYQGRDVLAERNRLALLMIAVWLLADEWFVAAAITPEKFFKLFDEILPAMAAITPAHRFVQDPDRREELVRMILRTLDYRPANETVAIATDRLSALSSVEQKRLLAESRAAEKRSRAIREALIKKAAEESADKWTRE